VEGWHPTGVFGTFAATTAASKLLSFTGDQVSNALGIAGSQASGILQCLVNGSPMKRVHSGLAARNGVLSALLTYQGLIGPEEVFEGRLGFYNTYLKGIFDPEKITAKLGEDFAVAHDSFKLYPVCSISHSSIDAALDLLKTYNFDIDDIQEVNVGVHRSGYSYCCEPLERKYNPQTMVDIEFNIPFAVAVALSKKQVTMNEVSELGMKDQEVLRLGRKVKPYLDPELRYPKCKMEIVLKNGKKLKRQIDVPKGWPNSTLPWSIEELFDKFRLCASTIIPESDKIERIIRTINNLENLKNITYLGELVR
jgi:2-methylcitrate dehydratase PrpD